MPLASRWQKDGIRPTRKLRRPSTHRRKRERFSQWLVAGRGPACPPKTLFLSFPFCRGRACADRIPQRTWTSQNNPTGWNVRADGRDQPGCTASASAIRSGAPPPGRAAPLSPPATSQKTVPRLPQPKIQPPPPKEGPPWAKRVPGCGSERQPANPG